jgi:hypothetical protein
VVWRDLDGAGVVWRDLDGAGVVWRDLERGGLGARRRGSLGVEGGRGRPGRVGGCMSRQRASRWDEAKGSMMARIASAIVLPGACMSTGARLSIEQELMSREILSRFARNVVFITISPSFLSEKKACRHMPTETRSLASENQTLASIRRARLCTASLRTPTTCSRHCRTHPTPEEKKSHTHTQKGKPTHQEPTS